MKSFYLNAQYRNPGIIESHNQLRPEKRALTQGVKHGVLHTPRSQGCILTAVYIISPRIYGNAFVALSC